MADLDLNLSYNGNDLPAEITQQLIDFAENELNVPPSYLITKLHYEGLWGGSIVAQENNNWGGMTWVTSWSDPFKRTSGVTVTRGSERPAIEGGHYIRYENVQDFITDWSYLIRKGGIYNVANSSNFDEAVKGMFKYGGAQYDYATMNVEGTQRRYELYLAGMKARRNAINDSNNGILDELDEQDHSTDPDPDKGNKPFESIIEQINKVIDDFKEEFSNFEVETYSNFLNILSPYIHDYNTSKFIGNDLVKITKTYNNSYKIDINMSVKEKLENLYDSTNEKLGELKKKQEEIEKKDEDTENPEVEEEIPTNNIPFFPHKKPYRITSGYGRRVHPVTGEVGKMHWGVDYADKIPGTSVPVYATQDSVVTRNGYTDGIGYHVYLKHTGDDYNSAYLHLASQSPVNVGDIIKKGDQIGMTGETGQVTGVHLHFAISTVENDFYSDNTIDPEKYLQMRF